MYVYDFTICGECKYHKYDDENDDWVCDNPEAEDYGIETPYQGGCSDGEDE